MADRVIEVELDACCDGCPVLQSNDYELRCDIVGDLQMNVDEQAIRPRNCPLRSGRVIVQAKEVGGE